MNSVLIVGCGNMGASLLGGMLNSNLSDIRLNLFDIHKEKTKHLEKDDRVRIYSSPPVEGTFDFIFLCIKPADLRYTTAWLKGLLEPKSIVVSLLAGTEVSAIESEIDNACSVVRAMPNICATVHQAATAISFSSDIDADRLAIVRDIFSTIGKVVEIKETLLDAVTGLSGSGPAYFFMIIEALIDGGVKMGIPRNVAKDLVIQTMRGSCDVVESSNEHPAVLKDKVTTPGGTTIHAIHELESHGLRSILISAVATATAQSVNLGKHKVEKMEK